MRNLSNRVRIVIRVRLRRAMDDYKIVHSLDKFTYRDLAKVSGVPYATLQAIGNRKNYSPTFHTLDKICRTLNTSPAEILDFDRTKPHRGPRKPRTKTRSEGRNVSSKTIRKSAKRKLKGGPKRNSKRKTKKKGE